MHPAAPACDACAAGARVTRRLPAGDPIAVLANPERERAGPVDVGRDSELLERGLGDGLVISRKHERDRARDTRLRMARDERTHGRRILERRNRLAVDRESREQRAIGEVLSLRRERRSRS